MARADITPSQPVPMAGYAARTKPFERVEHSIFAKAIALEDDRGTRAVLITADLVGIPRSIADPICAALLKTTGLKRSQIILSSSHTHSAPLLTTDEKTRYEGINLEDGRNLLHYTRELQAKIVGVASQALENLKPARLSWGTGIVGFAMNRREFTKQGVVLGVNSRGLVDRSVPVLRIDSPEGDPQAVLFGYACHNTTLTGTNTSLCGDYAGFAQRVVQERYPGCEALFMMGCGGDANPYPRGTMDDARDHGRELGTEVARLLGSKLTPLGGPLTCALGEVALPLQQFTRAQLEVLAARGPSWRTQNARQLLEQLDRTGSLPTQHQSPVSVWQFSGDLTLVALPGEVVVDYVPLIEQAIGPLGLWVAAYCHDVCGYIPSGKVLEEGGYECRGLYTAPGFFDSSVEKVLVQTVRELASQAGRP